MKLFFALLLSLLLAVSHSLAQTHPQAEARRFMRGVPNNLPTFPGSPSLYQSAVIPADQQRGLELEALGNNASLYVGTSAAQLPWFCRIHRTQRYHISSDISGTLIYPPIENPIAAFGELGGGTPLYANRDYRFGAFAGFRDYTNAGSPLRGIFRIRAYSASALASGQTNVGHSYETKFELPWPGDANWNQFLLDGAKKVVDWTQTGLKTTIEIVGGGITEGNSEQWNTWNDPFVITHRASATNYYFVVEYQGWTQAGVNYPMVSNALPVTVSTADFSPLYALDFTNQPPWRSTFLHAPQFNGEPVPSWYYGKSFEELQAAWMFVPSTPGSGLQSAKTVDYSPELRSHPILDEFVTSMGSDPIALANYVFNEIELADPIGYNEDGGMDEASISCGGLNRGALATFLEKQGNPWEQCSLLVYLLRKANVAAVYCEPEKDKLGMLDTQLSKLLRMQIKGAQDPNGEVGMPHIVPTNYPWVCAWIESESRWVHLFPWLKDTEVTEGGNLYDQFPADTKTGAAWVRKYLRADPYDAAHPNGILPEQIGVYQQDAGTNGLVVMEAEGFHEHLPKGGKRWEPSDETGPSGYSGTSWMRAMPNTGAALTTTGFASQSPRLDYQIDFNRAGTHYIWIRGQGTDTNDNSVHIGLNSAEAITASNVGDFGTEFGWKNRNTSNAVLTITVPSVGRHTINVWMREDGFRLDKLLLTSSAESTFVPMPDGSISLEAESFSENLDGQWYLGPGSPGAPYIPRWILSAGQLQSTSVFGTNSLSGLATLKYNVAVGTGSYKVWLYGKADIANSTAAVSLAGATGSVTFGTTLGWQSSAALVAGTGPKVLSIVRQADGVSVDKILIVPDLNYTPSGIGQTNTSLSKQSAVESNVPSNLFPRYARAQLALSNTSFDDLGIKFRDRRYYQTTWDEFPRPFNLYPGNHVFFEKLADRVNTFDTVRVQLWSDRNKNGAYETGSDGPKLDTGEWLSTDLHNRRFYMACRKTPANGTNTHQLRLYLAPYRTGTVGAGNFTGTDKLSEQLLTANLGNATPTLSDDDDMLQFEITHRRQKRATKFGIAAMPIGNGGAGYSVAPDITIDAPPAGTGHRQALATAYVAGGQITKIVLTDPGYGYTTAPSVNITPNGSGSGAIAAAVLQDGVQWVHPLGIAVIQTVTEKPKCRKGDLAALCFDFGHVTDKMLRAHAGSFWGLERSLQATPTLKDDVSFQEQMQSTSAYLMGMSYYYRVGQFRETTERLHKTRVFSSFAAGLSTLTPYRSPELAATTPASLGLPNGGEIIPQMATVDMFYMNTVLAANGTAHADSGMPFTEATQNFLSLLIAESSAQEHGVINDFYQESAAISTVKLLQRAKANTVRLTKANYTAAGEVEYQFGTGTPTPQNKKKLKDWDSAIWQEVLAVFAPANEGSDFAEVFITPGPVASASASYTGMGAMIFGTDDFAAVISDNKSLSNGGSSSSFPFPLYSAANIPKVALLTAGNDYKFSYRPPARLSNPVFAPFSTNIFRALDTMTSLNSSIYRASLYQSLAWNSNATLLGLPNAGIGTYYGQMASRGSMGATSHFGGYQADSGGIISSIVGKIADPVSAVTGEFYVDAVDLTLPGPMPLSIRRNYSSQSLSDNEFGHGWKLAYFPYLVIGDNGLIYGAEMDGSVIAYRQDSGNANLFTPKTDDNPSLRNVHDGGVGSTGNVMNNRLVKSIEGTDTIYTLSGPDGQTRRFKVRSFAVDTITRSRPYLDTWKDAHGNSLTATFYTTATDFRYGQLKQISASNGNFVGFEYDVFGHIVEAWTGDGRRVKYTHDAQGDLRSVTLPDGAIHSYEYEQETSSIGGESVLTSKHLLIQESKPDGRILVNVYDAQRRVVEQKAVVDSSTPLPVTNATFTYGAGNTQNPTTKTWTGTTTVADAYGRPTVFTFTDSLITNEDAPETPAEVRQWYAPSDNSVGAYPRSLKQITDRRGVVTFLKYDTRGNLLEKSVGTTANPADLDGDGVASAGEKAVTTWTYTALNLPDTQTDPSGVVTRWFYENASYPYLATRIEKHSQSQLVSKVVRTFYEKNGTPSAYGLLQVERVAADSLDEARTEWQHDQRGYATLRTQLPGTTDPNITTILSHNGRGELIGETDALGRKWKYSYDAMGRRIMAERRDSAGTLIAWDYTYYNRNGEVEWNDGPRYDPEDYVWNRYDANGRQTEEVRWRSQSKADGSGVEAALGDGLVSTTFSKYDKFNNLVEVRSPRRHSVTAAYDGIGRLTGLSYYDGYFGAGGTLKASEALTYEPGGKVWTHTSVLGGTATMLYNARGQLRQRTNADSSVEGWRYYTDGRLYREILRNGSYWETIYDDFNRSVTRRLKTSAGAVLKTHLKNYDRRGNCTSETADGFTFTRTFDDLNRPKTVTNPATATSAQQTTTFAYPDGAGREQRVTNGLFETTITLRDPLGRVESVEVRSAVNALVRKTSYAYSADQHGVTTTEGDGAGAIVSQWWADHDGNTVLEKMADGSVAYSFYDSGGLLSSHFDRASRQTSMVRNWRGDVTQETRPGGVVVGMMHDVAGNLLQRDMPGGLSEQALYNNAGRVTQSKLVAGASTTRLVNYAYHPAGHVWAGLADSVTDARGITTTNAYDDALRVASQTSTQSGNTVMTRTLGYNERDLATSIAETGPYGPTLVARTFDAAGAISTEAVSFAGTVQSSLTQWFDEAGRRWKLDGAGPSRTFAHRADGRMASTTVTGAVYATSYGNNGLLTSRVNPFRTANVLSRDALGRASDSQTFDGEGRQVLREIVPSWSNLDKANGIYKDLTNPNAENLDYIYDQSGRLASEELLPLQLYQTRDAQYFYDGSTTLGATGGIGVRTLARRSDDSVAVHSAPNVGTFARVMSDGVGGSQVRAVPLAGTALGAKSVSLRIDSRELAGVSFPGWQDALGQWSATALLAPRNYFLTARATHPSGWADENTHAFTVAPRAETVANTYDAMGNVQTRTWSKGKVQTFTWDARGRLVSVFQTGAAPLDWWTVYDGLGRRVYTQLNGGFVTRSVFDPEVEFLELGISINGGQAWKIYGPDMSGSYGGMQGLGGLEAVIGADGVTRGMINDWWGNTVGYVAAPGGAMTRGPARFTGFGPEPGYGMSPLDGTKPLHELLGYRGLTLDPPGYFHMGTRSYDPQSGRWLSPDPVGHAGSLSLYDYCDNDPLNVFDPDGRWGKEVYNGGYTSLSYRAAAQSFNQLADYGMNNNIQSLAMLGGGLSTLSHSVADMTSPKAFVDGTKASYQGNLALQNGSHLGALNATLNPAYHAMAGFYEAGTGEGISPSNLGEKLNGWERGGSFLQGVGGTTGTVTAGLGTVSLLRSGTSYLSAARTTAGAADDVARMPALPLGEAPYQLKLFPDEAYSRTGHYGNTPTAAQRASVPAGMEFDHNPTLVQHYYEGNGGLQGFNLTQTERLQHARSLISGSAATPAQQRAQGAAAAAYSKRMKKANGL